MYLLQIIYSFFFFTFLSPFYFISIYTNLWFSAPLTWLFLLSSHQSPLWQNFALLENHSLFRCCISLKLPSYHTHKQRLRFSSSWSGLDVSVHGPILSLTYTFSLIQRSFSNFPHNFTTVFHLLKFVLFMIRLKNMYYPLTHIGSLPTNIPFYLLMGILNYFFYVFLTFILLSIILLLNSFVSLLFIFCLIFKCRHFNMHLSLNITHTYCIV